MIQFVPGLSHMNPMFITSAVSHAEAISEEGPFVLRVVLPCPCCWPGSLGGSLNLTPAHPCSMTSGAGAI